MIRTIVDTLADNAALEVPVDAMTAMLCGLNGMLESVHLDLAIVVNSTNITSTDANDNGFPDSESDKPELSVKSSTRTIEGGLCPTDLFDEGEELAQIMSDSINKATLKALSKHVPGESPLEVPFSLHVPLSCSQP
jgi:hypothetical protein